MNEYDKHPGKREPARRFQDLIVWQKSHALVLGIYQIAKIFPREETYALGSQLRRAAVSVPANIAEGFRRRTNRDKARFVNTALCSLEECRYYLILAEDLGYAQTEHLMNQLEEVSRMTTAYQRKLN